MQALVLTADQWLSSVFGKASTELGMEAHITTEARFAECQLSRAKFDTVVLDFDTVSKTLQVLGLVRSSRANKSAVILAVATDSVQQKIASRKGASFLLHRPIDISQIRRTLAAARGFMVAERRRYFRCAVQLAVLIARKNSEDIHCTSMNISSSGMGINTPATLNPGETLNVTCMLPGGLNFAAPANVIWDDGHGKSGLYFDGIHPEMQKKLECWLDSQFSTTLSRRI
ncbi:MAG: PilZ domain-containing protein [Terriglobales bacterium]